MKLTKYLLGLLTAAAFTACSNDEIIPDKPGEGEAESTRYMTVAIRNANPNGRAGGDQSGDLFEEGYDYENEVSKARFYFFDAEGKPYVVTYTGKSYFDCTELEEDGKDMPNVEKKLKAVIVLSSSNSDETFDGINSMIAVANIDNENLPSGNPTLEDLQKIIGKYAVEGEASKGKFVMTSSSFAAVNDPSATSNKYGCETQVIPSEHIQPTREDAIDHPVEMYIERVVAKVRVTANWDTEKMTVKQVKYNNGTVSAVKLTNNKGENITTSNDKTKAKNIWLIFTGWDLSATAHETYLFKHVNPNWTFNGWDWNQPASHRSYWAMNPESITKKSLIIHKHSDALKNTVGTNVHTGSANSYNGTSLYCFENAADFTADLFTNPGTKGGYEPTAETRDRTVAYIAGVLVTLDNEEAEMPNATAVSYAEWAGNKYTEEDLKAAMFAPNQNIIYTRDEEPYNVEYAKDENGEYILDENGNKQIVKEEFHYHALTVDDMILVPAEDEEVNKANNESEASRRYLTYIRVKSDEKIFAEAKKLDGKYYEPTEFDKDGKPVKYVEKTRAEVVKLYSSIPGAKVWRNGDVYYYTDLRHLNTEDKTGKEGYYGVVRNHIYEVIINTVYGLGTPVLRPVDGDGLEEFPIIPQKPEGDAFFLGARLNILSWRVVKQGVSLDW